jgi:hypothetical protein
VQEDGDQYSVALKSDDDQTHLAVHGHLAPELPDASIFGSLEEASDFFQRGLLGYSVTSKPGTFDGLELRTLNWSVAPLDMYKVESTIFADRTLFPPGSVVFDCALLMKHVEHEWHGRQPICSG